MQKNYWSGSLSSRESLRSIAIWISPVLRAGRPGIFDQLNWKTELRGGKEERFSLARRRVGGADDMSL